MGENPALSIMMAGWDKRELTDSLWEEARPCSVSAIAERGVT
jgi:hypothetical protein